MIVIQYFFAKYICCYADTTTNKYTLFPLEKRETGNSEEMKLHM